MMQRGNTSRMPIKNWYALRFKILLRDRFTCQSCGQSAPAVMLHVDHLIPLCEGGTNLEENLLTSCSACNRGKESLRAWQMWQEHANEQSLRKSRKKETWSDKLLMSLTRNDLSAQELSDALRCPLGTIRVLCGRLLRQGLIVKRPGPKPQRWSLVERAP